VATELARSKLDLVGAEDVRWDKGGTVRGGNYYFSMEKKNEYRQLGIGFFVRHKILSSVKRVEFIGDRFHKQF
jgi:hypothetical protein